MLQEKLEGLKKVVAERRSDIQSYKVRCDSMFILGRCWSVSVSTKCTECAQGMRQFLGLLWRLLQAYTKIRV